MERSLDPDSHVIVPTCVVEYVGLVTRKMRYRRHARAEVGLELRTHFEDALKEYVSAEDCEIKARELIKQFGDARLLATLCRRAKRRGRPLWAKAGIRTIQAAGAFAVASAMALVLCIVWFINGRPNPAVDYLAQINQMNAIELLREDNAWSYYAEAFALYVDPNDQTREVMDAVRQNLQTSPVSTGLTEHQEAVIRRWVEANEPAWRQFLVGSEKRYYQRYYEFPPAHSTEEPWLYHFRIPSEGIREMAHFGAWRACLAVADGTPDTAIEDCLALARASVHWQRRAAIFEQLFGSALSMTAYTQMLQILRGDSLPADDVTKLQDELTRIYVDGFLPRHLDADKACPLDAIQHVFTEGGPGGGHLIPKKFYELLDFLGDAVCLKPEPASKLQCLKIALVHAGRDETQARINELFDYAVTVMRRTPHERYTGAVESVKDRIARMDEDKYAVVRLLLPPREAATDSAYTAKIFHEATLTVLALKQWHNETGGYPAGLSALVEAGYIAEVPADPFSSGPLVYKRIGDDFALYSLGRNLADDGGTPGVGPTGNHRPFVRNGDLVFWPPVYGP